MLKHDTKAFWQFFSIYFGSVAFLILVAGYFYFGEQKKILTKKEQFSMIEHIRKLKMNQHETHTKGIEHSITFRKIPNFNINNFVIKEDTFESYLPYSWEGGYYFVQKDKKLFYEKLSKLKRVIITVQIALLVLFASLSYFLSMRALRPMKEAIVKLDNFSKDLIHDLNTPITSMLLNIKLLDRQENFEKNKPLRRIKQSLADIGKLHSNLSILLQENSLAIQEENIFDIVDLVVEIEKKIYPSLEFIVQRKEFYQRVNADALKQVLQNIVSNACKYNVENGYVKIYMAKNSLMIEDGGVGIKNPSKIFDRDYKEHKSGHGIGLDIVKRLCEVMDIEIRVESKEHAGTAISLLFRPL